MGRPKTYDRDDVLERAMLLFWERGYEATSTSDLEERMAVNRYSLYAEFGSKQKLYEAALDRYIEREVPLRTGALERPGAGLAEVRALLKRFASAAHRPGIERGCLLCNAASERAGTDPATRERVERYVKRFEAAFANALTGAIEAGELPRGFDSTGWARSLTTTVIGMFVMLRSRVDAERIRDTARVAIAQLDANRTPL